ncbi:MAG: 1-phosphofructokinase [Vulcanimicrobiaceae bacterium]
MSVDVLAITLNAAIDETIVIDRLVRGEVHRAHDVRFDAAGKGINVASILADWKIPVAVTGVLGASNAAPFEQLFATKAIDDRCVRVPGATRTNVKLVDRGATTDVNLPGVLVTPEALARVDACLATFARSDAVVVLAGSLPRGVPTSWYADAVACLRAGGARVVLDAAGDALAAALTAPVPPTCVKPNRSELQAWAGRTLGDLADVADVARSLHARGVAWVVVSLGAEGALFVGATGTFVATLATHDVASTVGAGDAMVAGIAAGLRAGADIDAVARLATAFAVAKLARTGAHLPSEETVRALARDVRIARLDEVRA